MDDKRKRSKPDLNLCLKTQAFQEEPSNKLLALDEAMDFELKHVNIDPNVDLKKLRRTISNRLSAQRARNKRVDYIAELEKKVKNLEGRIAFDTPEIENEKDKYKMLKLEGQMLREQLDSVTDKSKLLTVEIEENKLELRRLKGLPKALKNEHDSRSIHLFDIERQGSNPYDESESTAWMDMDQGIDQYLNLDAMNFFPPKND
ncbi:hypothetical protein K7X08_003520 [Anisodus acutangulus]|uniref:BZIP domain-containing protein n=1 Tax=Anisodus acutangulus TaxID=402998 RepID=A0A9Q1MFH2_9SOLA|nr:hypothetical protein K7X08_003520 [Anisodus acutangulus]